MSDERWIIVPHWDRFQHYTDRNPPWIKAYTELLHNDDWLALTDAQRGVLLTVWLEFAASCGQLRVSRMSLKTRSQTLQRTLEALNHAGFIQVVASKPLALARSRDLQETEKNKKGERTSGREPEQRHVPASRQNAGAYHKHHREEPDEQVPMERIEAYLTSLRSEPVQGHSEDVAREQEC